MQDRPRDTTVEKSPGLKVSRQAEGIAGVASTGLALTVGVITLLWSDLMIPVWLWVGILAIWWVAVSCCTSRRLNRGTRLAFYGVAVLTSWTLMVSVPPATNGDTIVILLVVVVAIGGDLLRLRSLLVLVVLNTVVTFLHFWIRTNQLLAPVAITGIYLIVHLFILFLAYTSSRESRLRTELEQKNLKLETARILLEESATSTERLRISRELHDLAGHHLTVLNLELEAARHRDDGAFTEHVGRAGTMAKDLLTDVRTTVGQLREVSPVDLQKNLEQLAGTVPSLDIHVDVDPRVKADNELSATLVRAAQEIIANTIKHADATELELSVAQQDGMLTLSGANDGTTPRSVTTGNELADLRQHTETLGGRLSIRTRPHFTMMVQLPS